MGWILFGITVFGLYKFRNQLTFTNKKHKEIRDIYVDKFSYEKFKLPKDQIGRWCNNADRDIR